MWGRVVEIMTAVWLAASPFIFQVQGSDSFVLIDSLAALLIVILSGLSYWHPTRHAHLLILVVATGLTLWGRFADAPPPPIHQNHIVVGLFLLMIAIIPNEASRPPHAWRSPAESH
ncbi:SPW repeat domain-containing protein [Planctomycetes bacterium TBK1r]|uniref:SPW repeat-containing integral membrane domain-containing protein n=1 Tax=Stieleria magnilauensis TaxID=2527963 RepID=A0ABX5XXA9_9BACT|nr:hypothetical protein TBK1r_53560 [Planctomycetes bacterium TBK1r]